MFDWLKRGRSGEDPPSPPVTEGAADGSSEARDAELVDQAIEHIEQKDIEGALRLLLDVVSRTPQNYVHQFEADGVLHVKLWNMRAFLGYVGWLKAKGEAGDVVWVVNAYPRAFYYLGYLHVELGDFATAIEFLDRGLRLEPGSPRLSIEKAQALGRLGWHRKALEVLEQVLSHDGYVGPNEKAVALRGKGFWLIELGDLDAAEAAFHQSRQYEPESQLAAQELEYIEQLRNRYPGKAQPDIEGEQT